MKNILYILLFTSSLYLNAQTYTPGIGVNTENPKRTLDVNGTTISKGETDKWFFENPGIYSGKSNDSYLTVIDKDDNQLKIFNPSLMSYASINYASYRFNRLPNNGLISYDTKIDASKYHVMVGGFIIYGGENDTTSTTVSGTSTKIKGNVLYSSRAYIGTNNTWILKFQPNNNILFNQVRIDLVLNVAIYRKELLMSDTNTTIVIDMKNTSTGNAPRPNQI